MHFKCSLHSKEKGIKINQYKVLFFGIVLIMAFFFFLANSVSVKALETEINGTTYNKTGESEDFIKVDLSNANGDVLTFIQGNGEDDKVAIRFTIKDLPSNYTSIKIVESEHSDSATNPDSDEYDKDPVTGEWTPSASNIEVNGIIGSAIFTTDDTGKINVEVVYRIRKGSFGLKFIRIFFYEARVTEANPVSYTDLVYVISKPIDTVEQGSTCTSKNDTICTDYVNGETTRESKELNLYIPEVVAYNFKTLNGETSEEIIANYQNTSLNTIYAINYFIESADGTVTPATNKEEANRSYLYVNFTKTGIDTQETVNAITNGVYINHITDYVANKIDYFTMEVDSTGAYFFYITDIFGNVKEVVQDVTDVKNRSIETKIKKGNAIEYGYGAEETFTNESVAVTIEMTVQTNFEFGLCVNDMCADIIKLTADNIKHVKYWRVDVRFDAGGNDMDAFILGDPITKQYASEDYAASGTMFNLFCKDASVCTDVQTYDPAKVNSEDGAGFSSLSDNILTMYVGLSGRYRFYIEDIYGNNTWGAGEDLNIEEYRNPRVEVYAIDKHGPELTFDHSAIVNDLNAFDIETYEYYTGIELPKDENGNLIYDGRMAGTEAEAGIITSQIYYPFNRDSGQLADVLFTDEKAIELSHVIVSDYVYYYDGNKDLYADYFVYKTVEGRTEYYAITDYDHGRINTISKNTKHNSNGLKLSDGSFTFNEINYYHHDGNNDVCTQIGGDYTSKSKLDCVNYYLDHGVDFIIEFVAEDAVGNVSSNRVYVNVVDTTPPGFTHYGTDESNAIRSSNMGTECRMEIGQEIGGDKAQNKTKMLECYNVIINNNYNFEDNVYINQSLSFANRIADNFHVKLYVLADNNEWVDLEKQTFIPNRTGYYDIKIELYDDYDVTNSTPTGNKLVVLISYFVDKKIVLIQPLANDKFYGEDDSGFDYCVYIDENNSPDRFKENPYENLSIYTSIYCTNDTEEKITEGKNKLFRENIEKYDFIGELSRLESIWYNAELGIYFDGTNKIGVENNYVGLYRIILGTLTISEEGNSDYNPLEDDYIIKIHPTYRDNTNYNGTENDNLVTNNPLEDDNEFSQSNVDFTIKQIVAKVTATGGSKNYGEYDTNYENYNDDAATNKYLNGFSVDGLITNKGQYNDADSMILGVLRREAGENVGKYNICNYRGLDHEDNELEEYNNMYLDCLDYEISGVSWNTELNDYTGYVYTNGILNVNANYLKSRALYVETNKGGINGKTLNVTDEVRNNNYANYVIQYVGSDYVINPIDLVVQPAPGQRREYNATDPMDPNPWEIILYGLVDGSIKRETADTNFNGFTVNVIEGDYYESSPNDNSDVANIEANKSEERDNWYLYHNGVQLKGYKTNETYKLLRNTDAGSIEGSAKLVREAGIRGGWYLYYDLANDVFVGSESNGDNHSKIAIVTNDNDHCAYDTTGHIVTVNGTSACKNYNLIYNPYYTNSEGYTVVNHPNTYEDADFVYRSTGLTSEYTCQTLDPDVPCTNTESEPQKIYKILFEIYRRDIILEFNSAIEEIMVVNDGAINYIDVVYGQKYDFYQNNFFDINYYTGKSFYPEDYLFICYQNVTTRSDFDPSDPTRTGCTGDPSYGLTQGDSWVNIGLTFKMHEIVSNNYNADDENAIPAGVYYVYADIKEEEKTNYNFKYQGGTMTIKSASVDIQITSYLKEYGEKYYSKYGIGHDYENFAAYSNSCILDGFIINNDDSLISLGEGIYCFDENTDFSNSSQNIYGFQIIGLVTGDNISDNFSGRPNRDRSVSISSDINGLQDNVGVYNIKKGSIATKNNNPLLNNYACSTQINKGDYGDCAVVTGKEINNYVVFGETRSYIYDMALINDITSEEAIVGSPQVEEGSLFITPATLTITVTGMQTKMYGCAYNIVNTSSGIYVYNYQTGYSNCVEVDGVYYDLGYEYTVSGDKDYQIASNGFDYTSQLTYKVSGIIGTSTFRPNIELPDTGEKGIKVYALNDYGTLYRIPDTPSNRASVYNSVFANNAAMAQKSLDLKEYQEQMAGNYIITLGNVDAALNESRATYSNTCDVNNMPMVGGAFICKNYHIDYYGTRVYNTSDTQLDVAQQYLKDDEFPSELIFTITKRKAYVYTNYDQKIYGDPDPDVAYLCGDYNMDGIVDDNDNIDGINGDVYYGFCTQEQVNSNKDVDASTFAIVNYGLTRYYTKYNSLAKAPWNGIGTRNDVQTDIIEGKISRKGMGESAPAQDDIRGLYEYVYDNEALGGTVKLKDDYGTTNYDVNFYENGLAVNVDGNNQNSDEEAKPIKFEIVLRQIKIAFVSFDKVYGEHDDVTDYDILVCAPSEEFDFENMKCINKDPLDKHGLSPAHLAKYVVEGVLNQTLFKEDFVVRFKRVFGENVSCGTSGNIQVTLNGSFFGVEGEVSLDGTVYTKELMCNNTAVAGKNVYETLAYIDQSSNVMLGYNYQVNYTIGYVNITPRPILITPNANQGFMYGNYHNTLIPAIDFTDSPNLAGLQPYGLVNDLDSEDGICLKNIDYYNNGEGAGTCFNINDRKDEYSSDNNMTTSTYDASIVDPKSGLANLTIKNFVFGDAYTDESSVRSALGRKLGSEAEQRYNRNVGVYTITKGDLTDKSGNYLITVDETVTYTITSVPITVTPEETVYAGTSQNNQYKIYGEQDKELTFTVITSYTVASNYYAEYNDKIVEVCTGTTCVARSELKKYSYDTSSRIFSESEEGTYIKLLKDDIVRLEGFAYDENEGVSSNLNYGANKTSNKTNTNVAINQGAVTGSKYYDIVCAGISADVGCNTDKTLSYGETSRILLGYLYVDGYAQKAGTYNIVNGMVVANNEFNVKNYEIDFVEGIKFTIIPRPIGVQIQNITKVYGQATDKVSCEIVDGEMITPCVSETGILIESADANFSSEGYLRNNFLVEYFEGYSRIQNILGNNYLLYVQNSTFVNGLATQSNYSQYSQAELKNSEHLGIYVSRDERNTSNGACLYDGDTYGFCEDVGTYALRFYGYLNEIDNISANNYAINYKPSAPQYTGLVSSVENYYYGTYWGYNPNYFVIVVDSDTNPDSEDEEVALEYPYVDGDTLSTDRTHDTEKLLKSTGTLTINKKEIKMYVNTSFYGENPEIYYVEQNTNPPSLPLIDNSYDLKYESFESTREEAVYSSSTYGKVIWGRHPSQVRSGDKLVGELAYCNTIISGEAYNQLLENGITSDYSCGELIYESDKNDVDTNLIGYVPIVRDSTKMGIVNQNIDTITDSNYENNNYSITFYPGALRIEEDDTKPVVEVNRPDVYIEANAIGEYSYECVGENKTTTYEDCNGISVVGKTELTAEDPILNWLIDSSNYATIIKVSLPTIVGCESNEYECTASAFYQLTYGKGRSDFTSSGGIKAGVENELVAPFTMNKESYINNTRPDNLKELIITLVSWFGVTAYDEGEIRNGIPLDKHFDKYWYLVIEQEGTNGAFDISKVGKYKVHFYVMDNAGNVSEGNMVEEDEYKNVGTLHIIDTTKPVVGTLNLYNGRVECNKDDCTIEDNWVVAEDTYLPVNILGRYNASGAPDANGKYIIIDKATNMVEISNVQKYSLTETGYVEDNLQGKYIKIAKGSSAVALKHYSWSNSPSGIWLTITGGSDNSYTETTTNNSQWDHYFSRDGGITWFLYDRTNKNGYLALDANGTREILIKAIDNGVRIDSSTEATATYTEKYYGAGNGNNTSGTMTYYSFEDSSINDDWLKAYEDMTDAEKEQLADEKINKINAVGWNVSDWSENDSDKANTISMLIYGRPASSEDISIQVSNYEYYKDKRTAYLDRTNPIISFGTSNGDKLYVYEYGCEICVNGYTEHYAGAIDEYVENSKEIASEAFDKNHSIVINHKTFASGTGYYQGDYTNILRENLVVSSISGGLGSDMFAMNGVMIGQDIRNVYYEERRYVIYAFDSNNVRTVHDLSSLIPVTSDTTDESYNETAIYNIITNSLEGYAGGDVTYTIVYSVIDKAGNESVYIARGVVFAKLVPDLVVTSSLNNLEQEADGTYYLNVNQGDSAEELLQSLSLSAGSRKSYVTQTVYYNGELVVDDLKYNPNIYKDFNTNTPGVYEITYNLNFKYYGSDGKSELISADPIKLVINIKATPPIVKNNSLNMINLVFIVSIVCGALFTGLVLLRKRS